MRILLCGAAILDIVCIIGSLFYAYNIQMVVHTFTDLLYQDWNMCDNLVSKLKFCYFNSKEIVSGFKKFI